MTDYGSSYGTEGSTGSTVTAFFDDRSEAEAAAAALRSRGVPDSSIRLTAGADTAENRTVAEPKGFFESLADLFVPDEDRYTYAEGLSRGGYLLTVTGVSADLYDTTLDVLDDAGAVDIDERSATWQAEGWSGYQASAGDSVGTGAAAGGLSEASSYASDSETDREETVPVIQERLRVGKRDVSHGRVRVRSYVVEEPVSEQVELSEERVVVERRPVDRPLTGTEDVFRDRSIEAEERGEEAVVSKEARVVEEIGLRRERESREETISDTVRHTEVEVDDERTEPDPTGRLRR